MYELEEFDGTEFLVLELVEGKHHRANSPNRFLTKTQPIPNRASAGGSLQ